MNPKRKVEKFFKEPDELIYEWLKKSISAMTILTIS